MKTSDRGIAFLEKEEGSRTHAYKDQIGVWTCGVGHTGPEVKEGLVWSPEQVKAVLKSDLARFEAAVNDVKHPLTQYEFDALVSFTFNVGVVAFLSSTLKKLLDVGDLAGAAEQFERWTKGAGLVLPVLVGRREREKKLFLTGDYSL